MATDRSVSGGDAGDNLGDVEERLQRVDQLLAELDARQRRVWRDMGRDVRAASADVERLNRTIEEGATEALEGLLTGTRRTRQAMEHIWSGFMHYFSSQVVRGIAGALGGILPSPGGVFGSLVRGFLGLFGLQEGGLVRGSREGRVFRLGENFTDELVVPLTKLGLTAADVGPAAAPAAGAAAAEVNVYPQFVVENRSPLEADLVIYRLAERGRLRLATRAAGTPPTITEGR